MDRRILVTLMLAIFISLMGVGIIAPIMPIYAQEMGASGTTLGLMVAGFAISRGVLQPFVGGLSDRKGRKNFLVVGLAIYALTGFTYVFATTVEHLIIIRIIHGVGSAMIVPIAMSYFADMAPEGQEGRYMGLLNVALFSGFGGGPVLGGVFRDSLGIDSGFYAMTALSALSLALVLVFLPPHRPDPDREAVPPLLSTFRRMMRNPRVTGVLLGRMSTMVVMIPTMAFLPILMTRFIDASGLQIGLVLTVRVLVSAGLQWPAGSLVDRSNKVLLMAGSSLLMAAAVFALPFVDNFALFIGLFAVMGVADAVIWPSLSALATHEGRAYGQGSMMGVFNMAMSAGIFVGSLGAGAMVDAFGLSYAFYSVAALLAASTGVSVLMITRGSVPEEDRRVAGATVPVARG